MRHAPTQNRLLAALPRETYERLSASLELFALPRGLAIHEPGSTQEHAVFPVTSIVSVLTLLKNGSSPQSAVIGNDGVVGIALVMGGAAATNTQGIVQNAGHGYRIPANALRAAFDAEPVLRDLLLRYAMALSTQMSQTAACNRSHKVEQQVCRLLLMCMDRWASNRLSLTHERIGNLLGVRREAVTESNCSLAAADLISYRRGCVTVLDRAGLVSRACECYRDVCAETNRLLPEVAAPAQAAAAKSATGAHWVPRLPARRSGLSA